VQFNSTLPLARYAQSHYALLVHWEYALHSTNRATCSAFSLSQFKRFNPLEPFVQLSVVYKLQYFGVYMVVEPSLVPFCEPRLLV
jgi:hypothetical protein